MGELATLISALATLVTAIGGAVAIVVTAVRTSKRERETTATNAATDVVDEILSAAADGEITTAELEEIRDRMQGNDPGEAGR